MNTRTIVSCAMACFAVAVVSLLAGCGGGGGGVPASSPVVVASSGHGLVRANVSFTDSSARAAYLAARKASRTADQTTSEYVVIDIAITGYYSGDGSEFDPITATLTIDLATGYGTVSVSEVPIGYNHILTAVATWPDGSTDTVMGLIYEVAEGSTTDATADEESTVLVNAALAYAALNDIPLSAVDNEVILSMEDAIAQLAAQGIPYSEMNTESITAFLEVAEIEISPATASVELGGQQLFTASLTDNDGVTITDVLVAWEADSSFGTIDSGGIFTATGVGTTVIVAAAGDIYASATVTITSTCTTDADCDDTNSATIDTCLNPGTNSASCSNAPVTCSVDADCDDGSPITVDTCYDPGTEISVCENYPVACATDLDCTAPTGVCLDGGTVNALCIECTTDADCTAPTGVCVDGGTATAMCIECLTDADCAAPTPACLDGGLLSSMCVECIDDYDCDDADKITWDVCEFGGTTTAYCDYLSPRLASDISLGGTLRRMDISGDESTVYVSGMVSSTATIYVIDTISNSMVSTMEFSSPNKSGGIEGFAIDPARNLMYVNYDSTMKVVDLSTETEVQVVPFSNLPFYDITVARTQDLLLMNTLFYFSLDVIDLSDLSAPQVSIPTSLDYYSASNFQMAVDETNSKVIVPGDFGDISIVDLSTMAESQVLSPGYTSNYISQVVIGKNSSTAFAVSNNSKVLMAIDTVTETIIDNGPGSPNGNGGGAIGMVEDPGHLFIDELYNSTVMVNATGTLQTLCTISVPGMSYYPDMVVDHTNRKVFISSGGSGLVHVIEYVSGGTSCVACDPANTGDNICCDGEVDGGLGTDCYLTDDYGY